ncbi:hypothetical protein MBVR141_0659 [Mycoplasmopsis bovirhinis]|uniref:P68 family surface lipoprotein n=1 Tax=Mycoplasmopsis bovirhinis TaxID=29553 RepID=UPI000BB9D2D5|nr:P80 family lipoprotein [Mycoplasmopsis bovirhinis]BBA22436.1 hypothetical protein MBVR141_0659 [Mycoplasmopsis bovirhinis]
MSSRFKKYVLTLGTSLVSVTPMALVVSCGTTEQPKPTPTPADNFKTTHADVLTKTETTIRSEDEAKVTAALNAYNGLDASVKNSLADQKSLLDRLKAKIESLKATANPGDATGTTPADTAELAARKEELKVYLNFVPEAQKTQLDQNITSAANDEALDTVEDNIKAAINSVNAGYYDRLKASTNKNRRFQQNVKNEIVLATTFSETGAQFKTINSIIEAYNGLVDQMNQVKNNSSLTQEQKDAEYKKLGISPLAKKVVQKNVGSGYSAGAEKVDLSLSSNDADNFFNLILNYSTVAAKLAARTGSSGDMLLSFNSLDQALNTDLSQFDSGFSTVNSEIENVTQRSTYVLPLLKSTQVLSLNASVLGYILSEMKSSGVVFDEADGSNTFFEEIITKGSGDKNAVATLWGAKVSTADTVLAPYKKSGFKLSKTIFESYTSLLEFATIAQSLFVESAKGVDATVKVFGIDNMTGVYEQALFSALGGDKSAMLQTVSQNNGRTQVSFNAIQNNNGAAYIQSQQIFTKFSEAMEKGAIYAFPSGQYASNDQTKHQIAFSIGSTAGYSHNFKKAGDKINNLIHTETKYTTEISTNNAFEFADKNTNAKKDGGIAYVSQRYKNVIWPSTTQDDDKKVDKRYDWISKSPTDDTIITDLYSKTKTTLNIFFKVSDAQTGKLKEYVDKLNTLVSSDQDKLKRYNLIKNGVDYVVYAFLDTLNEKALTFKDNVQISGHTFQALSDTNLLNENELVSLPTPSKWNADSTKKVLYVQGPSLIGIKSNDQDEAATRAFVKWLMTSTNTIGNTGNTALVELQKSAGYISAVNDLEASSSNASKIYGSNGYLKIAYEEFVKTSKDENYVIFEEPAGTGSDAFRKNIATAWETTQSTISNKVATKKTFQDFVTTVTRGNNG